MPNTTMKEGNFMGFKGGYTADDHDGHKGEGDTPEHAQEALEEAQADNARSGVYESLGGVVFTSGSDKDD